MIQNRYQPYIAFALYEFTEFAEDLYCGLTHVQNGLILDVFGEQVNQWLH